MPNYLYLASPTITSMPIEISPGKTLNIIHKLENPHKKKLLESLQKHATAFT